MLGDLGSGVMNCFGELKSTLADGSAYGTRLPLGVSSALSLQILHGTNKTSRLKHQRPCMNGQNFMRSSRSTEFMNPGINNIRPHYARIFIAICDGL